MIELARGFVVKVPPYSVAVATKVFAEVVDGRVFGGPFEFGLGVLFLGEFLLFLGVGCDFEFWILGGRFGGDVRALYMYLCQALWKSKRRP